MNCKYSPLTNRYADNELSEKEKYFIEKHIKTCAVCAQEIKDIQLIKQRLNLNKIESAPDTFWQDIECRLQEDNSAQEQENIIPLMERWSRKLIPVPVAVALAAALFFYSMPAKETGLRPGLPAGSLGASIYFPIPQENVIDKYVFGTNFSNVSSQIEKLASQSGLDALLY